MIVYKQTNDSPERYQCPLEMKSNLIHIGNDFKIIFPNNKLHYLLYTASGPRSPIKHTEYLSAKSQQVWVSKVVRLRI